MRKALARCDVRGQLLHFLLQLLAGKLAQAVDIDPNHSSPQNIFHQSTSKFYFNKLFFAQIINKCEFIEIFIKII